VFTLLETLYHSFDMLAKRRRVFKVETVGDCYVAGESPIDKEFFNDFAPSHFSLSHTHNIFLASFHWHTVTGLPEPRADHGEFCRRSLQETTSAFYTCISLFPPSTAIVMARFAKDCIKKMNELTQQLEKTLGPDTADLSMRVGLHSGTVTAGVLRGEKSRFQL